MFDVHVVTSHVIAMLLTRDVKWYPVTGFEIDNWFQSGRTGYRIILLFDKPTLIVFPLIGPLLLRLTRVLGQRTSIIQYILATSV